MKLIGVTDDCRTSDDLLSLLQKTEPYVDRFILREKSKSDDEIAGLVECLASSGFPLHKLIIHARPGLAEALAIKEVQLPGFGLSLRDAKKAHPALTFGLSVHSFHEAAAAQKDGADWLLYGHLYPTASKPLLAPRGIIELQRITEYCTVPVYAIGGIQASHLPCLKQIGAAGAAILSQLEQAQTYREEMICNEKNH